MAYNFKNLADVELLSSMPENANIIVEVDGATRRAPKEDGIGKLVTVETLDEVPENATVLVEVDGEIKRVPGKGLGGGTILEVWYERYEDMTPMSLREDETATSNEDSQGNGVWKANMTYDEVLAALKDNKLTGAYFNYDNTANNEGINRLTILQIDYAYQMDMPSIAYRTVEGGFFYWPDNTFSWTSPSAPK